MCRRSRGVHCTNKSHPDRLRSGLGTVMNPFSEMARSRRKRRCNTLAGNRFARPLRVRDRSWPPQRPAPPNWHGIASAPTPFEFKCWVDEAARQNGSISDRCIGPYVIDKINQLECSDGSTRDVSQAVPKDRRRLPVNSVHSRSPCNTLCDRESKNCPICRFRIRGRADRRCLRQQDGESAFHGYGDEVSFQRAVMDRQRPALGGRAVNHDPGCVGPDHYPGPDRAKCEDCREQAKGARINQR